MSDVFISYAREDQKTAGRLATALDSMGFSVWWDRDIPGGSRFRSVIERELKAARCVIVLWSSHSVESDFVLDEAGVAGKRGVLVPVRIDTIEPPMGFGQTHTIDLAGWIGGSRSDAFNRLVEAVTHHTRRELAAEPTFAKVSNKRRWLWLSVGGVVLVAALAATLHYYEGADTSSMALLPGGRFSMGSDEATAKQALTSYAGGIEDGALFAELEQPRHDVTLDPFYLDKYEVTVAEFRTFLNGLPASGRPSVELRGVDHHPVTGVTWTEASRYCWSVGKQLPTEAQWEYAARGGDRREFPWGQATPTAVHANFCESTCSDLAPVDDYEQGRSAHDVFNLAGNAAEWVHDAFDQRFYEKSGENNPVNERLNRDRGRVVRGGSYADGPYFLRAAARVHRSAHTRDPKIGFRCARSSNAND